MKVWIRFLSLTALVMEEILVELQKSNIDIDIKTLSYHIKYLLGKRCIISSSERMSSFQPCAICMRFFKLWTNNFGHAVSFLTVVYVMHDSGDNTCRAVQLVVVQLRLHKFQDPDKFFPREWFFLLGMSLENTKTCQIELIWHFAEWMYSLRQCDFLHFWTKSKQKVVFGLFYVMLFRRTVSYCADQENRGC